MMLHEQDVHTYKTINVALCTTHLRIFGKRNNSAILGLLYSVTEFKVTFLKYKYEMNN